MYLKYLTDIVYPPRLRVAVLIIVQSIVQTSLIFKDQIAHLRKQSLGHTCPFMFDEYYMLSAMIFPNIFTIN